MDLDRRIVMLAAALLASGCGGPPEEAESREADPDPVAVGRESMVVVGFQPIRTGPVVSGTLEPERSAQVRAEVGGSVLQVYAEEGQAVGAGQLLARIDESALRDAQLSARAGVRSAENALQVARREAERAERLVAGGALAPRDLELARSSLSSSQAQLADAQTRLAQAEKQLEATRVRSPIRGTVSERAANGGDVVAPGAALFTIIDPASLRLSASVPSSEIGSLGVGMPVQFRVQGYEGQLFTGTIERINPAVDPQTGQVPVWATVPNTGGRLAAGLFVEGRVAAQARSALVVPATAVAAEGSTPTVLRVRGGRAERVAVRLGLRDSESERVEVVAGVAAGDTVLTGAAGGITPGTPVRIGPAPAATAARREG